jgi:hypothetical protein
MLTGDFLFIPEKIPQDNETEMLVTDTVLVHTIPGIIKDLPIAFGLHSDVAINREVQLSWEVYGGNRRLGDFGGPLQLDLAPNEVLKTALKLPDFEALVEGKYTFVMFVDNDRFMDLEVEIRLPRE